jgi:hypothetical protein
MSVPNSEVGYTSVMTRRKDHEVHKKDIWWHWGKNISQILGFESHYRWRAISKIIVLFIRDIKFEESRAFSAIPRFPVGEFPENKHIVINTLAAQKVEVFFPMGQLLKALYSKILYHLALYLGYSRQNFL